MLFEKEQINVKPTIGLITCLKRQELPEAKQELEAFFQSQTVERFTQDDLTLVMGHRIQKN